MWYRQINQGWFIKDYFDPGLQLAVQQTEARARSESINERIEKLSKKMLKSKKKFTKGENGETV